MTPRGEGFQRGQRVDPAPRGRLEFPLWARLMVYLAMLLIVVAVIALLFATGDLSLARSGSIWSDGRVEPIPDTSTAVGRGLAQAAERQVGVTVAYDAAYVPLEYPGGDVPADRGVCTDVVIRAFRKMGVDLQAEVHKDMAANFNAYPHLWGLDAPDSNIDHRRVPNLQTYFRRQGWELPVTDDPADYQPGDVVTWEVLGRPHTGLVSTVRAPGGERFCIVHNIGAGTQIEDRLFEFEITGHYRSP